MFVNEVTPAPDATHLLVVLGGIEAPQSHGEVLAALAKAKPRLRAEVASEITRKRVPDLSFRIVVDGGGEEE